MSQIIIYGVRGGKEKSMVHGVQRKWLSMVAEMSVRNCQEKRWPDWGLNPGPSGTAPGALTTELPGLGILMRLGVQC